MSFFEKQNAGMTDEQASKDRMRFTRNTTSSRLVILAILFDILYFVSIYKSDVGSYYYTMLIGASVIYNLVFLLVAFLSEEGVKNRKPGYSLALIVVGVLQVVRIFIIPMQAHGAVVTTSAGDIQVMQDAQFIRVIVYLVASAACCVLAGVTASAQNKKLDAYMKTLTGGAQ